MRDLQNDFAAGDKAHRASVLLANIIEDLREHGITVTRLAVMAAAVDAGADEDLATEVAAIARQRIEQEG
jgi:hypothetical protein